MSLWAAWQGNSQAVGDVLELGAPGMLAGPDRV